MPSALVDQIRLQQQDSHTYTAGHDAEWMLGPSTPYINHLYHNTH